MTSTQTPKVVLLCDFDGTATPLSVIDELFREFADPSWQELAAAWARREISTPEGIPCAFGTVKATRAEMEALLDSIPLDPALPDLIEFCQQRGYGFAIISDGLTWYIRYVLDRHGIADVPIYSNDIHFEPDGFRFSFPWYDAQTPLRGTGKMAIIQRLQADGAKVVLIGDGQTDSEAAEVADLVYATNSLLEYCRGQGIPAIAFSTLRDVIDNWREP
jgi:2-hydroxy-3-keto-5-methylthiopentenyl-1-phosphate phosphatase